MRLHRRKITLNSVALRKIPMNVRMRVGGTLPLTIKLTSLRVRRYSRLGTLGTVAEQAKVQFPITSPGFQGLSQLSMESVSGTQILHTSKNIAYA